MERLEKEASAAMKAGRFEHSSVIELAEVQANKPPLPKHCEFYWNAFIAIQTMRDVGLAASKLRWDDTMKYADRYRLSLHESEMLWVIIRALDAVVLSEAKDDKSNGMNRH
ncbi:phage tail assembly chaperone [Sphingobium ummariense]|uniref:Uncharacterized protein n=1 Tax=Sphingobium ummariense RL-3 TaxID=1346791 RepID=T0IX31_9SPHN|nr:hypothetical protein [Sphingobium ummariense]EQB30331.1 hypothetical protein M529_20265 [Sphingobium ummariense RL-3]